MINSMNVTLTVYEMVRKERKKEKEVEINVGDKSSLLFHIAELAFP